MKKGLRVKPGNFIASYGFYIIFLFVIIIYSILSPNFFTIGNLLTILLHSIPLILIAAGLTFVIITGNLDISVGSIAFVSSAVSTVLAHKLQLGVLPVVLISLAVAAFCGIVNGLIVVKIGINPLIVTLGMMISIRGVALLVTQGNQWEVVEGIRIFGTASIGPLYIQVIAGFVILILLQLMLGRTAFGKHVFAIGCDEYSARVVGIPVDGIKIRLFVLSGLFGGVAGLFIVSQGGSVHMNIGQGMEFVAIAAIVIGGTSLFGGTGSIIPGTMFGAITLTLIENGLVYIGASPYVYPFVRGVIIFIAMYVDSFRHKKALIGPSADTV
jgi:ribose/xylose/arabinose/galactoside ABC-type transport system permease subunit